jgi:hypothetical protein
MLLRSTVSFTVFCLVLGFGMVLAERGIAVQGSSPPLPENGRTTSSDQGVTKSSSASEFDDLSKRIEESLKGNGDGLNAWRKATKPRTWNDSSGEHSVIASFAGFVDSTEIRLKRQSYGVCISIPTERLSRADKEVVRGISRLMKKAQSPADTTAKSSSGNKSGPGKAGTNSRNGSRRPPTAASPANGGFDGQGFHAAIANAGAPGAIEHVMTLLGEGKTANNRIAAFALLQSCGRFFIKDNDEGHFNKNANPAAFAAAVSNITDKKVQKVIGLCKGTKGDSKPGALFIILSSCGTFIRQPGKFNDVAFNETFNNVDAPKVEKAVELTGSSRDFALMLLLRLAGTLVNDAGTFDATAFNKHLEAMKPSDFTGDTDQRVALFKKQMTAGQAATDATAPAEAPIHPSTPTAANGEQKALRNWWVYAAVACDSVGDPRLRFMRDKRLCFVILEVASENPQFISGLTDKSWEGGYADNTGSFMMAMSVLEVGFPWKKTASGAYDLGAGVTMRSVKLIWIARDIAHVLRDGQFRLRGEHDWIRLSDFLKPQPAPMGCCVSRCLRCGTVRDTSKPATQCPKCKAKFQEQKADSDPSSKKG